ncbi:uncharacterized protein LOC144429607 [Styela clava]
MASTVENSDCFDLLFSHRSVLAEIAKYANIEQEELEKKANKLNESTKSVEISADEDNDIYEKCNIDPFQGQTINLEKEKSLENAETALASRLKKLCNAFGEEKDETLLRSAQVLLEIGHLYIKKVLNSTAMLQKLNFIKASALLCGAKVRFVKLKNNEKIFEMKSDLNELNKELLSAAGVHEINFRNIFDFSDEISVLLAKYRSEMENKMALITRIENEYTGENLAQMEKEKIQQVENICEESTNIYLRLMQKIAFFCESLLGTAPCKYALTGLGSLARCEITLVSDFEHVIVLQDNINNSPNYSSIQEYFRWYAVIFQIIIVGLGETFIRSVGVKSFNDLYSDDKSKNWFYDKYTPCGIAFDGMVPHSCNNPLGRQEITINKRPLLELIQPVGLMAKFLTYSEELKHGYYLKDVLSRTCFVYGNRELHDDYLKKSAAILRSETMNDVINEQMRKISENRNSMIKGSPQTLSSREDYDIKSTAYRPITALLGYVARMCDIRANSTFDIIREMKKKKIINTKWEHKLLYAACVAIEARMKIYATGKNQRHSLMTKEFAKLIGEKSALDCHSIIKCLKFTVDFNWKKNTGKIEKLDFDKLISENDLASAEQLTTFMSFGKYEEIVNRGVNVIHSYIKEWLENKPKNAHSIRWKLGFFFTRVQEAYFFLGLADPKKEKDCYMKSEWLCKNFTLLDCHSITWAYLSLQTLCYIYSFQKRYVEEVNMFQMLYTLYKEADVPKVTQFRNLPWLFIHDVRMRLCILPRNDVLNYIDECINVERDIEVIHALNVAKADANFHDIESLSSFSERFDAQKYLDEIVEDLEKDGCLIRKPVFEHLLNCIILIQKKFSFTTSTIASSNIMASTARDVFEKETETPQTIFRRQEREESHLLSNIHNHQYCIDYIANLQCPLSRNRFHILATILQTQDIFATFSYKEMRCVIDAVIERCKLRGDAYNKFYTTALMAFFESAHYADIKEVFRKYSGAPASVKSHIGLQPFLYGCFYGKVWSARTSSNPMYNGQAGPIMKLVSRHRPIFKELFLSGGSTFGDYNFAVEMFALLDLRMSSSLLWKIVRSTRRGSDVYAKSINLLLVMIETCMIARKCSFPEKHIRKLRSHAYSFTRNEIKLRKRQKVQPSPRDIFFMLGDNEDMVHVHNLALDCFDIDRVKSAHLLWKIINKKDVITRVRRKSLDLFILLLYVYRDPARPTIH